MSGSASAVLARPCIRCRILPRTTDQFEADKWYTIRPVYFAMAECNDRTDLATRNEVISYVTECWGRRLEIELAFPPEFSEADDGCFARFIVLGTPDTMGGGSVTRFSSFAPNS